MLGFITNTLEGIETFCIRSVFLLSRKNFVVKKRHAKANQKFLSCKSFFYSDVMKVFSTLDNTCIVCDTWRSI
jgi:hypothetical protein